MYIYIYMVVSINGGNPKYTVYKGKTQEHGWSRGTPISGNLHMYKYGMILWRFPFRHGATRVLSSILQMDFPLETIQLLGYPIDGNPHMGYIVGHTTYEATVWNFLVCADRCYIPLKMVTTYYGFWGAPLARPETCCRVSAVSIDDSAAPETLREVVTVHWQVWNGGFLKSGYPQMDDN